MSGSDTRSVNSRASRASRRDEQAAAMRELDRYDPENQGSMTGMDQPYQTVGNEVQKMLSDRINPHELMEEAREEYLQELWNAFVQKSAQGVITEEDIIDIAVKLNIDCSEEALFERIDQIPEDEDLDFDTVVDLFDHVSSLESDRYREMDVDRIDQVVEVNVNPLMFLWYKTPCSERLPQHRYVLDPKFRIELKPRMSLLLTTAFFMASIGAILLLLIALLWRANRFSTEEVLVTNLRRTVVELSTLYEAFFYDQHEDELLDQVKLVGDMMNFYYTRDLEEQHRKMARQANLLAMAYDPGMPVKHSTVSDDADLLEMLGTLDDLGITFRDSVTSAFSDAQTRANSTAIPCQGAYFVNQDGATICLDAANSHAVDGGLADYHVFLESFNVKNADAGGNVSLLINGTTFLSPLISEPCFDLDRRDVCAQLAAQIAARENITEVGIGAGGDRQLWSANFVRDDAAVVTLLPYEEYLLKYQNLLIDSVNYLNFQFVRTTEVVLSRLNKTNGEFVVQATLYRFLDGCYKDCERFPPASRNAIKSFEEGVDSRMITPDYRPEPVAGASRWLPDSEMVLIMERDVQEVRGLGLTSLVEILEQVNAATKGTTEIEVFRQEGQPSMRDFDPSVACGPNEDCYSDPAFGVYFRFDCVHCQRQYRLPPNTSLEFLNFPKKGVRVGEFNHGRDQVYTDTVYNRRSYSGQFEDYKGDKVLGESDFIVNYSVGIMVKVDYSEINTPLMKDILTSLGTAVGFIVAGIIILMLLSNHSLNSIERDWITSKAKIEADKQRFGEMVRELIPPAMAERMLKTNSFVSETTTTAIVFADICNFTELTDGLPAKHVIRFVAYVFHVLDVTAEVCRTQRLCTVGDTYAIYSNEQTEDGEQVTEGHNTYCNTPAMRAIRWASVCCQLSSDLFVHFPERARFFKDAFKDRLRSTEPFSFPSLRFGGHCGNAVSGIIDTARAPKFDFFGIATALASRMCATGQPLHVHITSMMKETIEHDEEQQVETLIEFDEPRKTIVRGQGTITSYFLRNTALEVPEALLNRLGIQRARLMVPLHKPMKDERDSSLSSRPSDVQGSSRRSGGGKGHPFDSSNSKSFN